MSVPLESNPWFGYFVTRKSITTNGMIAMAIRRIGREKFLSQAKGECGHTLHYHPFAHTHKCYVCQMKRLETTEPVVTEVTPLPEKDEQMTLNFTELTQ